MVDYIDNEEISDEFFSGETVPGPNTIAERTNLAHLARIQSKLKSILRLATLPADDPYDDFKEASFELYQAMLNGEELRLSPATYTIMKRRYKSVPLAFSNPSKYNNPE